MTGSEQGKGAFPDGNWIHPNSVSVAADKTGDGSLDKRYKVPRVGFEPTLYGV